MLHRRFTRTRAHNKHMPALAEHGVVPLHVQPVVEVSHVVGAPPPRAAARTALRGASSQSTPSARPRRRALQELFDSPTYEINFVYESPVSSAVQAAFDRAAARWGSAITTTLEDVPEVPEFAMVCGSPSPLPGRLGDLYVFVNVHPIDGSLGVLGQSSPCLA
jgi:hypothetical protein